MRLRFGTMPDYYHHPRKTRQRSRTCNCGMVPQHSPPHRWRHENGRRAEHVGLQLRPHRGAVRRPCAGRGLRHDGDRAGAGGVVSPRVQIPGVRRHRNLDEQLSAFGRAERLALRCDSGVRVAAVPAFQHLHPHRPRHQNAAGPEGQNHRSAGIPDDGERLGARHAAGGIRGEARRHQMAQRRTGRSRPRRRRSTSRRCRPTARSPTCWRRARSTES